MNRLRYRLFLLICRIGWWVCPKTQRVTLDAVWRRGMRSVLAEGVSD